MGLSLLLFGSFWKGIIGGGRYIDSARTLPWAFNVIAYCYIAVFGVLALFALPKFLTRSDKITVRKVASPKSPFLKLLVTGGLAYIALLIVLGVTVGRGPAGLALFPLVMGFWILGPILPLALPVVEHQKKLLSR